MRWLQILNYFPYGISDVVHYLPVQEFLYALFRQHILFVNAIKLVKFGVYHLNRKKPSFMQVGRRVLVDVHTLYFLIRHYGEPAVVIALQLYLRPRGHPAVRHVVKELKIQLIPGKLPYASVVAAPAHRNVNSVRAELHIVPAVHGVLAAHNIAVFVSLTIPYLNVVLRKLCYIIILYAGKICLRRAFDIYGAALFSINICLYAIRFDLNGIRSQRRAVKPLPIKRAFEHARLQLRGFREHIRVALYLATPDRVCC